MYWRIAMKTFSDVERFEYIQSGWKNMSPSDIVGCTGDSINCPLANAYTSMYGKIVSVGINDFGMIIDDQCFKEEIVMMAEWEMEFVKRIDFSNYNGVKKFEYRRNVTAKEALEVLQSVRTLNSPITHSIGERDNAEI